LANILTLHTDINYLCRKKITYSRGFELCESYCLQSVVGTFPEVPASVLELLLLQIDPYRPGMRSLAKIRYIINFLHNQQRFKIVCTQENKLYQLYQKINNLLTGAAEVGGYILFFSRNTDTYILKTY